ncbi:MAG: SAM-dependent methyltransferase [Litorivicinus sp.]
MNGDQGQVNKTLALYDGTPMAQWQLLLEPIGMHYHFAKAGAGPIFDNSLEALRPWLQGHLLDLGCGFGGPAAYFDRAGYRVTCVSHSPSQLDFVRSYVPKAQRLLMDLNHPSALPDADTALMIESLSHLSTPEALLKSLPTQRLVAICHYSRTTSLFDPAWQMHFRSEKELKDLLRSNGWYIEQFTNDMAEKAEITALYWRHQLDRLKFAASSRHLQLLSDLADQILLDTRPFLAQFGLATIVAKRAPLHQGR